MVIGGFSTGCETTSFLAEKGNIVTIVDIAHARHLGRGVTYINIRQELVLKLRGNKNSWASGIVIRTDLMKLLVSSLWPLLM